MAFAQVSTPNPTQGATAGAGDQVPIFRVTVVGRTTQAINYRPRRGDTRVDFAGTALMPAATGKATVSGEKGYIKVDARFDKLAPPAQFGPEYLTYVLWAITPEGRATNLGEVQRDDQDARVQVTTELQAFGLVLTAEPYFAVTQPSDVVVMENIARDGTNGHRRDHPGEVRAAEAWFLPDEPGCGASQYQAARTGCSVGPGARPGWRCIWRSWQVRTATRPTPTTRPRVCWSPPNRLARSGRAATQIMMPARQAAQTAEDARLVGLQRQEEAFIAEQRRLAAVREQEAVSRAQAEEARRRQAELDAQNAAAARAAAERQTQEAAARAQTALAEQEAAQRAKADADRARAEAESARAQADAARRDAEAQAAQARQLATQSEQEKAQLRDQLRQQLNVILETRQTARGLIVNLSDVLFDTARHELKPGAREKLARVSGILSAHPGLKLEIEGHADSSGSDEYNQNLSERRAESVRNYLVSQNIQPGHGDVDRLRRDQAGGDQ